MKTLLILLIVWAACGTTTQTITSVKIGDWAEPTTWDCNCVPTGTDIAVIAHDSVTISTTVYIHEIQSVVGGKIHFTPTANLIFQ